jgi:hypothetical protein
MTDDRTPSVPPLFSRLLALILHAPWIEIVAELWILGRKLLRGMAEEGMYEVVEYESTLELLDTGGKRAHVHKREKVRYLQDNIIAYQDQSWGDGEILVNYHCTPGEAVDRYRPGHKTYILISLREVKHRSDVDHFHMDWDIKNGFLRPSELWAAEVNHRTRQLKIHVIFPKARPPLACWLMEDPGQRKFALDKSTQVALPDGRRMVSWGTDTPRLNETYSLKWEW